MAIAPMRAVGTLKEEGSIAHALPLPRAYARGAFDCLSHHLNRILIRIDRYRLTIR